MENNNNNKNNKNNKSSTTITNPSNPPQKPLTLPKLHSSLPTHQQLIDSLTAHISLYNSRIPRPNPNPNPNPRSSILKWFSSLTVHQRQSHLTTIDHRSTQILILMLSKLRSHGPGRFIVLPDIPDGDLPSLCYKRSEGLLSRVADSDESQRLIFHSARLFRSQEGENLRECSCSVKGLDTLTVVEDLVEDVERFVEVMDEISSGGFLRGAEEGGLGSDWVELEWLKGRGYYSIGAFVANRLEVGLRLAWMGSCGSGKKRGVKLKEKVVGAGVAANVFWRKKGCVDWWRSLGEDTRRKVFIAVLGKSMRSLICEILHESRSSHASEDWLLPACINGESLLRNIAGLATRAARLSLLEIIVTAMSSGWHCEYHISNVFFSTLGSVGGITDCVLRKLRGLFMVISLDCTKLELLGDGNAKESPKRPHEKLVPSSRRKRRKPQSIKKLNSATKANIDASSFDRPSQACSDKTIPTDSFGEPGVHNKHESTRELSSSTIPTEHSQGSDLVKGQAVTRKTGKGKGKKSRCRNSALEVVIAGAPRLLPISSDEDAAICLGSGSSTIQNVSNNNSVVSDTQSSEKCVSDSTNECAREHIDDIGINDHLINGGVCHISLRNDCHASPECHSSDSLVDDKFLALSVETINAKLECDVPSDVPALGFGKISSNSCTNLDIENTKDKSNRFEASVKAVEVKGKSTLMQGQANKSIYDTGFTSHAPYLSYEWPNLAPVYFQSVNSHIPPATDRLHLDVGNNWHNHIRQPYVPTIRQVPNSPIESSRGCILSRPLPMSLDWPPMVRSASGLAPSLTCNYDFEFISRRQTAFVQSYSSPGAQKVEFSVKTIDDEIKYSRDSVDLPEAIHGQELSDECDGRWMPEDELEVHAVSGVDYNQYFGGGVMYWNPSDHPFSRPPSLSSDDSLWAWHEADMNRAVDDMVAFSSSYSTNGLTSPPATSFCPPSGHQALGYVVSGNEVSGKVQHSSSTTDAAKEEEVSGSLTTLSGDIEGKVADSFSYPILRPIIIPSMSRERPKRSHDIKSPCIPANRQEQPRIKRPPSPVVLCVPRAPRPPPPSPVSDSRKHRGFPIVRSGSSSPRHWGMRGRYQDGINLEEACVRMDGPEVVWPSWTKKNLSPSHARIQPLPGTLLQDRLIALSQLARDQEHPDVSFPLQPPELGNLPTRKASLSLIHSLLHHEIDFFYKQVTAANVARKPFINWAVKRVARSLQVLWPRSRTNIFGSNATGLSLPTSDVDLVVCLPPVRNLEPIKEAGILEGRNGIKETCLQHAARYLVNQEWVKNDSLRTVENTAIPIIMLVVEVPHDLITSASNVQSPEDTSSVTIELDDSVQSDVAGSDDSTSPKVSHVNCDDMHEVKSIRLDISFKSPSHTGLQTTELVKALTEQFPAVAPLALVLKQFLADRSLDQSYSGGLSSYCLVLLVTRFLQHEHHLGRPINQNFGSLLMDFLYFFGNVFDPRQMRISVQGSGVYINRERGYSIDPLYIDDPHFPTNNVGRNCFRIHQCIKAFAEAYSILETELTDPKDEGDLCTRPSYRLLSKIIPNINLVKGNWLSK